ncbi:MAG: hypothetical protein GQ569_10630 [Methylococcaceae bacterium]|nr:hypothetical protein [Methylococcaceae bacterium]
MVDYNSIDGVFTLTFINIGLTMNYHLQAIVLSILFLQPSWVVAKEDTPPVTLDEATKTVTKDTENKVLSAKTKTIDDKKIHIIKILTKKGRIQHIKIDAETGKKLEKSTKDKVKDK